MQTRDVTTAVRHADGTVYSRTQQVRPETWRTEGWAAVAPEP